MVTPIETKRESVRSDHRRGCYENGVKAACSVQISNLTNCTAWSVQLAKWASWTASVGPTHQMGELDGFGRSNSPNGRVGRLARSNSPVWRVGRWVFRCLGSVVRGLEQPSLKTYLVNPFRNCYETWLSSSTSLFLWVLSFLFSKKTFLGNFPTLILSWPILTPTCLIYRIASLWKGSILCNFWKSLSMELSSIKSETIRSLKASGAGP